MQISKKSWPRRARVRRCWYEYSNGYGSDDRKYAISYRSWCWWYWSNDYGEDFTFAWFFRSNLRKVRNSIYSFLTLYLVFYRIKQCKISSGDRAIYPMHSFQNDETCFNSILAVSQTSFNPDVEFSFRTFRFTIDGTQSDSEPLKELGSFINYKLHYLSRLFLIPKRPIRSKR